MFFFLEGRHDSDRKFSTEEESEPESCRPSKKKNILKKENETKEKKLFLEADITEKELNASPKSFCSSNSSDSTKKAKTSHKED
jgi:hypothetical protein